MRKVREILRLRLEVGLTQRQTGQSCRVSPSTVWDVHRRFAAARLTWPLPEDMDDLALEAQLYRECEGAPALDPAMPDWSVVSREMRRKHVTLILLWHEYRRNHPQGFGYSWFCEGYRKFRSTQDLVMRQSHKAGEKCFVDYSGGTLPLVDPETGEVKDVCLFVGTLGASNFTFVEPSLRQDLPSWIQSHVRMFAYFGGACEILVPDNLKAGVKRPDYYEPDINPVYGELAEHYGAVVIPARVRHPKDKAAVENSVLIAERRILAALRNRKFNYMHEMEVAVAEELERLNDCKFQKLPDSRRTLFEAEERPALKPLPSRKYEYSDSKYAKVNIDYHIELEHHYYSVPYTLVRQTVQVRWTQSTVEILHQGKRLVSYLRSHKKGGYTTLSEHMPSNHRAQAEWTPERMASWAEKTGPWTLQLVNEIMASRRHPEQGFRSCRGLLRLGAKYGAARLEQACRRAVEMHALSCKSVRSILEKKLEDQTPFVSAVGSGIPDHENLRGPKYYQ